MTLVDWEKKGWFRPKPKQSPVGGPYPPEVVARAKAATQKFKEDMAKRHS